MGEPKMVAERNFGASLTCSATCRLGNGDVVVPAASIGKVCNDGPRFDQAPPSTAKVETKIVNNPPPSTANPANLKGSTNSLIVSDLVFVCTIIALNLML